MTDQPPAAVAADDEESSRGAGWTACAQPVPVDQLAADLRGGDREAMATVFGQHLDRIYNYCFRRTGSWSVAEDLSSTVFLQVWRSRQRILVVDGSLLPWLYGIATNVCRDHLRTQRRRSSAMDRLVLLEPVADHADGVGDRVADRVDSDRRVRVILEHLRLLPVADQDVFLLVCWEGLSYPQAADALGIPVGTVRSRLSRVRQRLRAVDPDAETTTPETTTPKTTTPKTPTPETTTNEKGDIDDRP